MNKANTGIKGVVVGMVLAVSAGVAVTAWAAAPGPQGRGEMGFMHGDPARMAHRLDRMLSGVNATEAQRTQIKQIAQAAASDLKAQRASSSTLRAQAAQLFTAPTVDANAVEALRQQMLAQHDQSSRRISQALVDISRVLTPEQRVQLAEQLKQRGQHLHRHHGPRPAPTAPTGQ